MDYDWQTPPQLAKEFGVHPDKIRGWINSGELEAVNLGDSIRPRWRIESEGKAKFLAGRSSALFCAKA